MAGFGVNGQYAPSHPTITGMIRSELGVPDQHCDEEYHVTSRSRISRAKPSLLSASAVMYLCPVFCSLFCSVAIADQPAGDHDKVEVLRDRWGVPHVFAETDAGACYGLGYATAEDRSFQMHYALRIMQGRLAEVIGDVKKTRRRETAADNDRKMRTFGFANAAKRRVGELDTESVGLLQAYSNGVNDYFAEHGDDLPELFETTGLKPETWTPTDCLLSWWHLAQFFATDGTRDLVRYRHLADGGSGGRGAPAGRASSRGRGPVPPPGTKRVVQDDSAAVVGRQDVTEQWIGNGPEHFLKSYGYVRRTRTGAPRQGPAGPKFSHAWVADGRFSGSGSAVLVSMPQTSVANPSSVSVSSTFAARLLMRAELAFPGSPIISDRLESAYRLGNDRPGCRSGGSIPIGNG